MYVEKNINDTLHQEVGGVASDKPQEVAGEAGGTLTGNVTRGEDL